MRERPRRIVFRVVPVGKPRSTRFTDRQAPALVRYRLFRDALQGAAAKEGFVPPEAGASLVFYLPMPRSWSEREKRAMDGQPHQQKPDKDNLEKAFWDALLGEDSRIWHTASVEKRWAREGRIEVTVP